MSRITEIKARIAAVPALPLYKPPLPQGSAYVDIWMDDAGDGRFVASVNDRRGAYSEMFAHARGDIEYLLAENASLQARLDVALEEIARDNEAYAGWR